METQTSPLPTLRTIERGSEVPAGHALFEEMGRNGDTKHTWDPKKPGEVEAARALFDTLVKKGHAIFRMKAMGGKGEQIKEFDPEARRLLAVPQLAGG